MKNNMKSILSLLPFLLMVPTAVAESPKNILPVTG